MATGEVSLSIDELVRPGMMMSGRATFSDGEPALWGLDQMLEFTSWNAVLVTFRERQSKDVDAIGWS